MTQSQLNKLVFKWQKKLRLQDWNIDTSMVNKCRGAGSTFLSKRYKEARVSILNPDQWEDSWLGSRDIEVTLVHELLHLHAIPFDDFKEGSPKNLALETMIELIAIALVNADRSKQ